MGSTRSLSFPDKYGRSPTVSATVEEELMMIPVSISDGCRIYKLGGLGAVIGNTLQQASGYLLCG